MKDAVIGHGAPRVEEFQTHTPDIPGSPVQEPELRSSTPGSNELLDKLPRLPSVQPNRIRRNSMPTLASTRSTVLPEGDIASPIPRYANRRASFDMTDHDMRDAPPFHEYEKRSHTPESFGTSSEHLPFPRHRPASATGSIWPDTADTPPPARHHPGGPPPPYPSAFDQRHSMNPAIQPPMQPPMSQFMNGNGMPQGNRWLDMVPTLAGWGSQLASAGISIVSAGLSVIEKWAEAVAELAKGR
jgi:hypothetical protein